MKSKAMLALTVIGTLVMTPIAYAFVPQPVKAPIQNELTDAYGFRTKLTSNPQCQHYATEADQIVSDTQTNEETKINLLNELKDKAKRDGCTS